MIKYILLLSLIFQMPWLDKINTTDFGSLKEARAA